MHLYLLDAIRFLCALYVLFFHLLYRSVAMGEYNSGLYDHQGWSAYGWIGVQVFFVISGFIVYRSSLGKRPAQFLKSRILRLYPAYWICLSITVAIMLISSPIWWQLSFSELLINFTMLQGFINVDHVDGVYWTLMYEMVFYFWVLIFLLAKRLEWLACFLQLSTLMYIGKSLGLIYLPGVIEAALLVKYSSYFLIGLTISTASRKNATSILMLIIPAISVWLEIEAKANNIASRSNGDLNPIVPFTIVIISCAMICASRSLRLNLTERTSAILILLGSMSYPLYLLHQNISYVLIAWLLPITGFHLAIALTMILTLALTYMVAAHFETRLRTSMAKYVSVILK